MPWERWVKPWEESIETGRIECDVKQCVSCGELPEKFWLHERRKRNFLVMVEDLVYGFSTFAIRWKCPLCGATFTMLPPFALPRKRYVKETVLGRIEEYLPKREATYRSVVGRLGYASKDETTDERRPSHSRAWHWIRELGEQDSLVRRAKRLIRAKDPASPGVGRAVSIELRKYKSQARRKKLQVAMSLLQAEIEMNRLFKKVSIQ